jgi:hypothetical protein
MDRLDDTIRRAWPILREAIRMRRTVTYTELAGRAGPPLNRRNLHRQLLIPLSERCRHAGLPDLSALVVRKGTGLPGGGWWAGRSPSADETANWAGALAACFDHRWPATPDRRLLDTKRTPKATDT